MAFSVGTGKLFQNPLRHRLRVALDADGDLLGEPDPIDIDVDLDDLGVLWPIVDAIAGKCREGAEPGTERQHHIGLRDQLYRRLRAVIAEGTGRQRMRAGKSVVMLIAAADWRVEPLGQRLRGVDRAADTETMCLAGPVYLAAAEPTKARLALLSLTELMPDSAVAWRMRTCFGDKNLSRPSWQDWALRSPRGPAPSTCEESIEENHRRRATAAASGLHSFAWCPGAV